MPRRIKDDIQPDVGLFTIGQMAHLNAVSEKTLRIYQNKGLLEPAHTDDETGYRYYTLEQCSTLDMILQLKTIGCTLDEIAQIVDRADVAALRDCVRAHAVQIERRRSELAEAHQVAGDLLKSCEACLNPPPLDAPMLLTLPERHVVEFPFDAAASDPDERGELALLQWELNLRSARREIIRRGWPAALFRNVGCVIGLDDLRAGRIVYNRMFVSVTPAFGSQIFEQARTLPSCTNLVVYVNDVLTDDGRERETVILHDLLDRCTRMGLEPAGDYVGEVIADGPAFRFDGRGMLFRMCLPVRLQGQPAWDMPSQHEAMTGWR